MTLAQFRSPVSFTWRTRSPLPPLPADRLRRDGYGAQGDGTADDANAIQAASTPRTPVAAARSCFPAGTFRVTRGITIYSDIVFRGAGPG